MPLRQSGVSRHHAVAEEAMNMIDGNNVGRLA